MRSKSQRRWMWANEPEIAARWEKKTPDGKKLPEKVKHAFIKGAADALENFGLKTAARECRLKIPKTRKIFHGADGVFRDEAAKNAELETGTPLPLPGDEIPGGILPPGPPAQANEELPEEQETGDIPVERLTEVLQALPDPMPASDDARQDPLNRDTMWGAPTDLSGGDAGGRVSDLGQNTGVGSAF